MSYDVERELINFDDIEFPDTLYKYRFISKENHQSILFLREAYFSSPSGFEDKYDCKVPTRWDLLTYEDMQNYYFEDSIRRLPSNATIEDRIEFAIFNANNNAFKDEEFVSKKQKEDFENFDKRIGVLCLTPFNNLFQLWEKYAEQHTGFCVGFEPNFMLKGIGTGAGLVQYHDELPVILPLYKMPFEVQMQRQVYGKLTNWEFEKEYRVLLSNGGKLLDSDRKKTIPFEAYKEIIIGAKMTAENIETLLSIIPKELSHVSLKKAFIKGENIEIENF